MGPKRGRKRACSPKKASKPKKSKDHDEEICWNFSCDACDRYYTEQEQLDRHFRVHKKCGLDDCKFEASAGEVLFHKKVQHDTGYVLRIMQLNSSEEIERWRKDRKEHFPKSENTELSSASSDSLDEQTDGEEVVSCEDVSDVIENELRTKPALTEDSERSTLQNELETKELTKYKPSDDTFQNEDDIDESEVTKEPERGQQLNEKGDDDPDIIDDTFQNEEDCVDEAETSEETERGDENNTNRIDDTFQNEQDKVDKAEMTEETKHGQLLNEQGDENPDISDDTFQNEEDDVNETVMTEEPEKGQQLSEQVDENNTNRIDDTVQNEEKDVNEAAMTEEPEKGQQVNEQGDDTADVIDNTFKNEDNVNEAEVTEETERGQQLKEERDENNTNCIGDMFQNAQDKVDKAETTEETEQGLNKQVDGNNLNGIDDTVQTEQDDVDKAEMTEETEWGQLLNEQGDGNNPDGIGDTVQTEQDNVDEAEMMEKTGNGQQKNEHGEMNDSDFDEDSDSSCQVEQNEADKAEQSVETEHDQLQNEQDNADKSALRCEHDNIMFKIEQPDVDTPELTEERKYDKPLCEQQDMAKLEIAEVNSATFQMDRDGLYKAKLSVDIEFDQPQNVDKQELVTKTTRGYERKDVSDRDSAAPLVNLPFEQEEEVSKPEVTENMDCDIHPSVEIQKPGLNEETGHAILQDKDKQCFLTNVCDICDCGFNDKLQLVQHFNHHTTCTLEGCEFQGHPIAVRHHVDIVHKTGYALNVWQVSSRDAIEKWKDERKRNFPRLQESDRDSAASFLKLLLEREAEASQPKLPEKMDCDILPSDEVQKPGLTTECFLTNFCDVCDCGFNDKLQLVQHFNRHTTCTLEGCEFQGHPIAVRHHVDIVHGTGYALNVWQVTSPEAIEKWRDERKRNFPSLQKNVKEETSDPDDDSEWAMLAESLTISAPLLDVVLNREVKLTEPEPSGKVDGDEVNENDDVGNFSRSQKTVKEETSDPDDDSEWAMLAESLTVSAPLLDLVLNQEVKLTEPKPSGKVDGDELSEDDPHSQKNSKQEVKVPDAGNGTALTESVSYSDAAASYVNLPFEQDVEATKPEQTEKMDCGIPPSDEVQKPGLENECSLLQNDGTRDFLSNLDGSNPDHVGDKFQNEQDKVDKAEMTEESELGQLLNDQEDENNPDCIGDTIQNEQDNVDIAEMTEETECGQQLNELGNGNNPCLIDDAFQNEQDDVDETRLTEKTEHGQQKNEHGEVNDSHFVEYSDSTCQVEQNEVDKAELSVKTEHDQLQHEPENTDESELAREHDDILVKIEQDEVDKPELTEESECDQPLSVQQDVTKLEVAEVNIELDEPQHVDKPELLTKTKHGHGRKDVSDRDSATPLVNLPFKQEEEVSKPEVTVNMDCDSLPGDEIQKPVLETEHALLENEETECFFSNFCDACDCGFRNKLQLVQHFNHHTTCALQGCEFKGQPVAVQRHIDVVHKTGYALNVWQVSSLDAIEKWKDERKKNFPRSQNIVKEDTSDPDDSEWAMLAESLTVSAPLLDMLLIQEIKLTEPDLSRKVDGDKLNEDGNCYFPFSQNISKQEVKVSEGSDGTALAESVSDRDSAASLGNLPFEQEVVSSQPEWNEKMDCDILPSDEVQKPGLETERSVLQNNGTQCFVRNFCDACNCGFNNKWQLVKHINRHTACTLRSCKFQGSSVAVQRHIDVVHKTGYELSVWQVTSPDAIEKWKDERKRNFPRLQKIEEEDTSDPDDSEWAMLAESLTVSAPLLDMLLIQEIKLTEPELSEKVNGDKVKEEDDRNFPQSQKISKQELKAEKGSECTALTESVSDSDVAPSLVNLPLEQEVQTSQPELPDKMDCDILPSDEVQKPGLTGETERSLLQNEDTQCFLSNFCDACNYGFSDKLRLIQHFKCHTACTLQGCQFQGRPVAVQHHVDVVHKNGYALNVWQVDSPEAIEKWKDERKKNFPRSQKIVKEDTSEPDDSEWAMLAESLTVSAPLLDMLLSQEIKLTKPEPSGKVDGYELNEGDDDKNFPRSQKISKKEIKAADGSDGTVLTESVSDKDSGASLGNLPFEQEVEASQPEQTEKIDCDILEVQKAGLKTEHSLQGEDDDDWTKLTDCLTLMASSASLLNMVFKQEGEVSPSVLTEKEFERVDAPNCPEATKDVTSQKDKVEPIHFFCDACEGEQFLTRKELESHSLRHVWCGFGGCMFQALRKEMKAHKESLHDDGTARKVVWHVKSDLEIQKWLEKRRENFPRLKIIEQQEIENAEDRAWAALTENLTDMSNAATLSTFFCSQAAELPFYCDACEKGPFLTQKALNTHSYRHIACCIGSCELKADEDTIKVHKEAVHVDKKFYEVWRLNSPGEINNWRDSRRLSYPKLSKQDTEEADTNAWNMLTSNVMDLLTTLNSNSEQFDSKDCQSEDSVKDSKLRKRVTPEYLSEIKKLKMKIKKLEEERKMLLPLIKSANKLETNTANTTNAQKPHLKNGLDQQNSKITELFRGDDFSVQESLPGCSESFHSTSIPSHHALVPDQSHRLPASQHTLPDTSRPPPSMIQAPQQLPPGAAGTSYGLQGSNVPPQDLHHSLPVPNYPPPVLLHGPKVVYPPGQNDVTCGPNHGLSTAPNRHALIQPLRTPSIPLVHAGISQGIPRFLSSPSVSRHDSPGLQGISSSPSFTTVGQPNNFQTSTACLPTLPSSNAVPNQEYPEAQLLPEGPLVSVTKKKAGWGENLNEWAKERMNEDLRREIHKKVDLFKVAQTTSTRENWSKFREQSRQVALLQKKAEKLNCMISDSSEQRQFDERKKQSLIMLEKAEYSVGPQFTCDACDLEFELKAQLDDHLTAHSHCGLDGCKFEAHPTVVKIHRTEVHASGYSKRIWNTNSAKEVEIWKEERKKNFPVPVFVHKEEGPILKQEESNTSLTSNTNNSNVLPNEAENSYKYYCDACNCGFTDSHQSAKHYNSHIKCGRFGCRFEGQPVAVQLHVDLVHTAKMTRVAQVGGLNSSEAIISWRKERQNKFPRLRKSSQCEDEEITSTKVAEPKPVLTVTNLKPFIIPKPKTTSEKKFFCDACDVGFCTKQLRDYHCSQHFVCSMGDCRFASNKEVFGLHIKWQHATGYVSKIWQPKSLQGLVYYIRERKQNYPSLKNKILAPGSKVGNGNSSLDVDKRRALATKKATTRFSSPLVYTSSSISAAKKDILSQAVSKLQTFVAPKQNTSKERLPVAKSDFLINTIIKEVRRSKWDEEPTYEDQSKLDKSVTHTEAAKKAYWQDLCNSLANKIVHADAKSTKDKHSKSRWDSERPSQQRSETTLPKKDLSKDRLQPQNVVSKSVDESKKDKESSSQNKRSSDKTPGHDKDVSKGCLREQTVASKSVLDDRSKRKDDGGKAGSVDKSRDAIKRRSSPIRNSSGEKKIRKDDAGNKQVSSSAIKSFETADASKKTRSNDDKKRKGSPVQDRDCKISRKDSLHLTHRQRSPVHQHVSLRGDSPLIRSRSRSRSPHRESPHRESSPFLQQCRQMQSNIARSDEIISAQSSSMPALPGVLDMIGGRTLEQNQCSTSGVDDMLSRIVALKELKKKELKQRVLMELVKEEFGDNVAKSFMGDLEGRFHSVSSLDGLSHAEPSFNQQPLGKEEKQASDRLSHSQSSTEDHLPRGQGFVPSSDNVHPVGIQSPPKKDLFSKFLNLVGSDQKEKIAQQLSHNREKPFMAGASSSQLHPVRVGRQFDELFRALGKEDKQASDRLSHAKPSTNVDDLLLGQGFVSSSDNLHPVSLQNPPKKENLFSKFLNSVDNKQKDKIAQQLARNREKHFTGVATSSQLYSVRVGPQFDDVDGTECRTSCADSSDTSDCNEKVKIARDIANILSMTGQSNVSDDVLAQLVQHAMKSKTSTSGSQSLKSSESCANTYPQTKRALPPVLSALLSSSTTHFEANATHGNERRDSSHQE